MSKNVQVVFLRGPLSSHKSTWFYDNFPLNWKNTYWVWKSPKIREHWKDWWERNQIYWKRLSNHPDAFWNPRHRGPEVWTIRVRRPDWFWGKSSVINSTGKADHAILTDCSKCIQMLQDTFPEAPQRLVCWVIDDIFWNRVQEKWQNFPLLKACPFYVRPTEVIHENQDEIIKTARLNAIIDKVNLKWDVWDIRNWSQYGWTFHNQCQKSQQQINEEDIVRVKKLPSLSYWKEQAQVWLT